MERAPLVPFAVALAAGTAAVLCTTSEERIIVASVLTALGLWCCNDRASAAFRVGVVIALGAGALLAYERSPYRLEFNQTITQRYHAIVLACNSLPGGPSQECALRLSDGTRVSATLARFSGSAGTGLLVRGRLTQFDGPRNPGEPDRRLIERERGFDAMLANAVVLQTLGPAPNDSPDVVLARMHAAALARLEQSMQEPFASILAGELWGERATLPPDLRQEFQDSGTMHVLVTAGLHLGVVAMLATALLALLPLPRTINCVVAALLIWSYAAFSGAHLPAVRAAVMITFALAARAAGAKAISWNAFACAVIVTLLADPQSILSASFAMSFSCCGAILLLADPVNAALERVDAIPARVREALTLTIATQLGVWPLTAATFLLFAPYAILANAAVVPLAGATMVLGAAQISVAPLAPLAAAIANLNSWLLQWMVSAVRLTSALPFAHIVMTPAPPWAIAAYDAALAGATWLWYRGARTAAAAALVVTTGFIIAPLPSREHRLVITVLDVGQADAIVIQTPAGHTLLVDAGGRLERGSQTAADSTAERVGEQIVVPFLIRHGVHHLDAVLVSHPHGDHVGGAAPVLRALGADDFADSGQQYGGFAYHDALHVLHAQGTPVVYPRARMVWRTNDGVTLTFLGPETPFITGSRNDINNNSLVFVLQYQSFRMLFTGDAGAEAERRILSGGADLRANVLKVGHHGSAYSSTPAFIDAVHPKYAIISVGRHNLFGHPAPSTIEKLQRSGASVYRTDASGAITIRSDGTTAPLIQGYISSN